MFEQTKAFMRKIILQEFVTIDGFATGQDGKTSFVDFLGGEGGKEVDKNMMHLLNVHIYLQDKL